jgi:protein gp37
VGKGAKSEISHGCIYPRQRQFAGALTMGILLGWTEDSWNPVMGCHKVSAGCRNCYAEEIALRYRWSNKPWTAANASRNVVLHPERLRKPFTIKKPVHIFVNTMGDLFHPLVPDEFVQKVFDVMEKNSRHTFHILTKRPERLAAWPGPWKTNIWVGTSVEDHRVKHRVESLKQCGAKMKFVAFEPLIGPIGSIELRGINWVTVAGERGKASRPLHHSWVWSIRDQCIREGIPFLFTQSIFACNEDEMALTHEDGTRWLWQQSPGNLAPSRRISENLS